VLILLASVFGTNDCLAQKIITKPMIDSTPRSEPNRRIAATQPVESEQVIEQASQRANQQSGRSAGPAAVYPTATHPASTSRAVWQRPRLSMMESERRLADIGLPNIGSADFPLADIGGGDSVDIGDRLGTMVWPTAYDDPLTVKDSAGSKDSAGLLGNGVSESGFFTEGIAIQNAIAPSGSLAADLYLNPHNPEPPPARLAAYSRPLCEPNEEEVELERFKRQALQSVSLEFGGVSPFESGSLRNGFVELGIGTGIPLGSLDHILGVTPRVQVDWLDVGDQDLLPVGYVVPEELYQFELQFFYRRDWSERLSILAIVSPAIRSDLSTDDRALRFFALGLLNWEWIPDLVTLSGGAVMLGRADLPVLPAVGLLWTPNRRTRLDLRFPLAKASYRLTKNGGNSETWAYVKGGLGGSTWAVTKADGETDEFSLRDYRLIFGWERLVSGGGGCFTEAGIAMGRRLEWERPLVEVEFPTAALIQAGWRY
jgi:hypothetical protein